jgi:hypothetical protein
MSFIQVINHHFCQKHVYICIIYVFVYICLYICIYTYICMYKQSCIYTYPYIYISPERGLTHQNHSCTAQDHYSSQPYFFKINCIKLQTIQEKHKKHYRISYGSSVMEELKEEEVVNCLARLFCIAKLIPLKVY